MRARVCVHVCVCVCGGVGVYGTRWTGQAANRVRQRAHVQTRIEEDLAVLGFVRIRHGRCHAQADTDAGVFFVQGLGEGGIRPPAAAVGSA